MTFYLFHKSRIFDFNRNFFFKWDPLWSRWRSPGRSPTATTARPHWFLVALHQPGVVEEPLHCDTPLGVGLQHGVQQLQRPGWLPARLLIHSGLDLPGETADVLVHEGQEATEEFVEQDPHAPDVDLAAQVVPATDQLCALRTVRSLSASVGDPRLWGCSPAWGPCGPSRPRGCRWCRPRSAWRTCGSPPRRVCPCPLCSPTQNLHGFYLQPNPRQSISQLSFIHDLDCNLEPCLEMCGHLDLSEPARAHGVVKLVQALGSRMACPESSSLRSRRCLVLIFPSKMDLLSQNHFIDDFFLRRFSKEVSTSNPTKYQ